MSKPNIIEEYYEVVAGTKDLPIVTVCYLIDNNGNVARGISVCSKSDVPNRKDAEFYSKKFAMRALLGREIPEMTRYEIVNAMIKYELPFTKKGELNPDLSWSERKMLFGKKGMYKYNNRIDDKIVEDICENLKEILGITI